jgi:hypothetical protein
MTGLLFLKYVSTTKPPETSPLWQLKCFESWRRVLKDKFPTAVVPLTAVLPNCQVFLPDPVNESMNECEAMVE